MNNMAYYNWSIFGLLLGMIMTTYNVVYGTIIGVVISCTMIIISFIFISTTFLYEHIRGEN